ncbi:MAG: DEAD/DEAH box helicase, partial [Acidobacteria bacterium]|nr:DEAD/DEAH box helicase [Acidobacteriota bacterium]
MLPVHLADSIREQILFYLQSTFVFRDRGVEEAFVRFLLDEETGLFKGPWVQLRRPFRLAGPLKSPLFEIVPPFQPFRHQVEAWKRLSTLRYDPQSTIITTGTGSGKTECFLYPILDHCLRMKRQGMPGIKAIILYPMNALAADQEKRFARTIWENSRLRGIRVGNYTGRYGTSEGGSDGTKVMGPNEGISDHETQLKEPPDILLTNYKMLDYLLMRPRDQRLWRYNGPEGPGRVQYLVLDELHTYDGAQGADVACLIRRLKERLGIARGQLCVVGTSATLDEREPQRDAEVAADAPALDIRETCSDRLARFATTLFEEEISGEAVIGEDRLTVEEMIVVEPEEAL